jgi:hypothetical protein
MKYSKSVMTAIAVQHPDALPTKPRTSGVPAQETESALVRRFNRVLTPYKWRCGECRRPCSDARSRENTGGTVARSNALVMWRTDTAYCAERVRFVGWLWELVGWSDAQIRQLCTHRTEAFGCREIPE